MHRYLFISAHCDDAMISCGGTMLRLKDENHSVHQLSFSNCGNFDITQEFTNANKVLGVEGYCHQFKHRVFHEQRAEITKLLYACIPHYDFIVTHSVDDRHPDHRIIAEESLRVFNCNVITYLGDWNGSQQNNYFSEILPGQLSKKEDALFEYKSQRMRSYMNTEFIRGLASFNGVKCGKLYAEGFKVERLVF